MPAAADHLGEADHEQCEIKILMAGGLLPLTRDAAGHHPEADQVYLVHGERHIKAFPKGCVLLAAWMPEGLAQLIRIHTFGLIYLKPL